MERLKKITAILLLLVLVISVMPISARAESPEPVTEKTASAQHNAAAESTLSEIPEYYGRSVLESMNKPALLYAYDQIVAGVEDAKTEISVYNGAQYITTDEVRLVMEIYRLDYAHHFWLDGRYGVFYNSQTALAVHPTYLLTGNNLTEAKARFDAAADRVLSGITPDMTEYEKELYIHDTLAQMVTYNESTHAHNAYGALVEGVAVCEGYAEAFQYLLHRAGIWSFIVTGNAGGPHAWNMVRIDGAYYHVDLTWNDQNSDTYYGYFNVTDAQIQLDHTIDATAYALPACTATAAFYYTGKDTYLQTYTIESVAKLLQENDLKIQVYVPADRAGFLSWFSENVVEIAAAAGVRTGFSRSYSYLGNEAIVQIKSIAVKVTNRGEVSYYNNLNTALYNCNDESVLRLMDNLSIDLNTALEIDLDLNGYDIGGAVTGNGITIYDSQTDDYTVNNGNGYGVIAGTVSGVKPAAGYISVMETAGISYHKVDVALDKLVLKAESTGLYYTGCFLYDEIVAGHVEAYGVAMSTTNTTPVADDTDPGCLYTTSGNSALLKNILTEGNTPQQNRKNAKNPIYARAYLKLVDGTILYSDANAASLQTMVETVDAKAWDNLSSTQKAVLTTMYQTYTEEMSNWNIPNLKSA